MEKQIFVKDVTVDVGSVHATVESVPVASEPVEPTVDRVRIKEMKGKVLAVFNEFQTALALEGINKVLSDRGLVFKTNTLRNALKQLVDETSVLAIGGKKNRTYRIALVSDAG